MEINENDIIPDLLKKLEAVWDRSSAEGEFSFLAKYEHANHLEEFEDRFDFVRIFARKGRFSVEYEKIRNKKANSDFNEWSSENEKEIKELILALHQDILELEEVKKIEEKYLSERKAILDTWEFLILKKLGFYELSEVKQKTIRGIITKEGTDFYSSEDFSFIYSMVQIAK